jgi:hypothetical protein
MSLSIEDVASILEDRRPANPGWKVIPNINLDRTWSSIRIRTPFFYPAGERIFVYAELYHRKNRLVRIHDEEITYEYLTYHDLGREFLRQERKLGKEILAPAGLKFLRTRPEISRVVTIEEVWDSIPPFAETLNQLVVRVSQARAKLPKEEPLVSRIVEKLGWSPEAGLATA